MCACNSLKLSSVPMRKSNRRPCTRCCYYLSSDGIWVGLCPPPHQRAVGVAILLYNVNSNTNVKVCGFRRCVMMHWKGLLPHYSQSTLHFPLFDIIRNTLSASSELLQPHKKKKKKNHNSNLLRNKRNVFAFIAAVMNYIDILTQSNNPFCPLLSAQPALRMDL